MLATDGDPASLAPRGARALRAVDPDLPLSNVRTMEEVAAESVASRRAGMLLLGVFGGLALHAGRGRHSRRDVAPRRAAHGGDRRAHDAGRAPRDVMRLVLREGLVQAAMGLAIGLGAACC